MDRSLLARWTLSLLSPLALATVPATVYGATDTLADEDLISYDNIVSELTNQTQAPAKASNRTRASRTSSSDPFENVWIHGGVGYATTMQTLTFGDGNKSHLNQKGFQATLGIDLFSEHWMAEGAARSFGDVEAQASDVSLKEFELKVMYKNRFSRQLGFRAGGGLAARYMTLKDVTGHNTDYTTPSSVATLGMDLFLSKSFSLGVDVSSRNTMIAETLDQSSFDATFRMDTHF